MKNKNEVNVLKKQLYEFCERFLDDRIIILKDTIADSRLSSQGETKSSAGDKYETSRELIQAEIEQNSRQLAEAVKLKQQLSQIVDFKSGDLVRLGSLVYTTESVFYIAIPAGLHQINGQHYAFISLSSPIGALLAGKKKGESVLFNGKTYSVNEVF